MKVKPVILIQAEDTHLRHNLKALLIRQGVDVIDIMDSVDLLAAVQQNKVDLIVLGSIQTDGKEALAKAAQIRHLSGRIPLILITRNSSEELAIAALKAGFNDYFKEPILLQELAAQVNRWLARGFSAAPVKPTISHYDHAKAGTLIGTSAPMQDIKTRLLRAAGVENNVLITGETGTGKELAAEFIHNHSARANKPLIRINCAAIPDSLLESEWFGYERGAFTGATTRRPGQFELAHEGSLFLDEIGDMSLCAQAKILRVIESKEIQHLGGATRIPVNFRVIAATNQELERLVEEKKFREDLYFRLNVIRIQLPPLKARQEDIPLLFNHHLNELSQSFGYKVQGITTDAMNCLLRYDWPGNVRELRNLAEVLLINLSSSPISVGDLPKALQKFSPNTVAPPVERERLLSALNSSQWNKSKAAQQLNWSRMTLYRKMVKYAIQDSNLIKPSGDETNTTL